MASTRGRGARGRGSGLPQRGASRGSSTIRGGGIRGNAQRGNTTGGGTFGQASRGNATGGVGTAAPRPKVNGFATQNKAAGAFGGGQVKGGWSERYETLEPAREQERAQAIRQGLIADPEKPRSLADAITPVGTCQDMCAEFERVERVVQNDVWAEEADPSQGAFNPMKPQPDEARMVKKFRRAAAGLEEQLPSDLRPPSVLKRTCDYLFHEVIGNAPSLEKVHHFVWDRTRAVRNDFSIQQVTKPDDLRTAIECYERIARFHILSLHQLAGEKRAYDNYDAQQEREQLDRTLLSLMQYYDDTRGRIDLPNEAEFRAYCVIFQLQDPIPDLEDRAQSWPQPVTMDRRVRAALDLYAAACNTADAQGPLKRRANHLIAQQDFQRFWTLVESKQISYLMACVAEIYFNLVRRVTLNSLYRGFRQSASRAPEDWTIGLLQTLLGFDTEEQVLTFCQAFGFSFKSRSDGERYINLVSVRGDFPQRSGDLPKQWKSGLVEEKRYGRTLPSIINGMSVRQARQIDEVSEEEQAEMEDVNGHVEQPVQPRKGPFLEESSDPANDEDSLFIPERRNPSGHHEDISADQPATNGFTFGRPSGGPFGQPSNSVESKPAEAPGKTLFDFTATSIGAPGATASSPAAAALPPPFKSGAFTFKPNTNGIATESTLNDSSSEPQSIFAKPLSAEISPKHPLPWDFKGLRPATPTATSQDVRPTNSVSSDLNDQKQPYIESAPTSPEKAFTFDAGPNAAGATSQFDHAEQPETKPSQTQMTSSNKSPNPARASTPAPSISPERRVSIAKDNKPKKPSPLANSQSFEEDRSASGNLRRESAAELFERLAKEVFHDEVSGFLNQYIDFTVQQVITSAQNQVIDERQTAQADQFREDSLFRRYGNRWREKLWRNKSAAKASQRRERARRGLDALKSSKGSGTASIASSRRGSVAGREQHNREMVDSMFQQTVRNGVRPATDSEAQAAPGGKRPLSSHGANASTSRESRHKRQKSTSHVDDQGRIAKPVSTFDPTADLLKRSSFLGFSLSGNAQHPRSTTQTDYFRLKALGINPVKDINETRGIKRRRDESVDPASAPSPLSASQQPPQTSNSMPPPATTPKKEDADDALFARLKKARENLAESTTLLRSDVAREEEMRRSLTASQSSNEPPSMAKARAEARWRASQAGPNFGTPEPLLEVPAYRLRESKFVPREQYGRAIERAKELRESRSREISGPESRFDQSVGDTFATGVNDAAQQDQPAFDFGSQETQAASKPNGSLYPSLTKWEPPAAQNSANLFSSVPQQPAWSFINGGEQSQLSLGGESAAQATGSGDPGFPAWQSYPQDFTMQPSQMEQSLSNSFGHTQSAGQNNLDSPSNGNGFAPAQPSYNDTRAASEAISLISDDDEAKAETPRYATHFAQQPAVNGTDNETDMEELLDNGEEDEAPGSYQNTNTYATNPYAALADQYGGDTEEEGDDEQMYEQGRGGEVQGFFVDEDEDGTQQPNGYYGENGDADEEEADGDIEDSEGSEDFDEEDEEFESESEAANRPDAGAYAQTWQAPKPSTFEGVGGTQEEAIELSD